MALCSAASTLITVKMVVAALGCLLCIVGNNNYIFGPQMLQKRQILFKISDICVFSG
jgi:hypothetical protein